MPTTRTVTAVHDQPVQLSSILAGTPGSLTVRIDDACEHAAVTLHTDADDGPAAAAVKAATLSASHKPLAHYQYVIAEVYGVSLARHHIEGQGTLVGGPSGHDATGDPPIHLDAVLPTGSCVICADTTTGDIHVDGTVTDVSAYSSSGAIRIAQATGTAKARTATGSVTVEQAEHLLAETRTGTVSVGYTDRTEIKTEAGAVTIARCAGDAHVRTHQGAVRAHLIKPARLDISTMFGDITLTAADDALYGMPTGLVEGMRTLCLSTAGGRIAVPNRWRHLVLPWDRAPVTASA